MQKTGRLTPEEWGKHYNPQHVDAVVAQVRQKNRTSWSEEMLKLTMPREKVLEIGCGIGATSLTLAAEGRIVTALDKSREVVALVSQAAAELRLACEVRLADAEAELPFADNFFDVSFQAGLLEHYYQEERIRLLSLWGKVSRRMISLIPNAASIAYRLDKAHREWKKSWPYGLTMPQYSLANDFTAAGFLVTKEYTIDAALALRRLPRWHPWRVALTWILASGILGDNNLRQGYLLVTIGEKRESC